MVCLQAHFVRKHRMKASRWEWPSTGSRHSQALAAVRARRCQPAFVSRDRFFLFFLALLGQNDMACDGSGAMSRSVCGDHSRVSRGHRYVNTFYRLFRRASACIPPGLGIEMREKNKEVRYHPFCCRQMSCQSTLSKVASKMTCGSVAARVSD